MARPKSEDTIFGEQLSLALVTGTKQQVKSAARQQGVTSAEFIRSAIRQALQDARKPEQIESDRQAA